MTFDSEMQTQATSSKYYEEKRYKGNGLLYHTHVIRNMLGDIQGKTLDVGCGTGIISKLYPDKDIVGIDPCPEMLKYHAGNCHKATVENMPFNSNLFDNVICRSVLHHLPKPMIALAECFRVLKPNGKIFVWETNKSWLATLIRKRTQHGGRFSEYHTAFKNLPDLIGGFFTIDEIKYEGFTAYPLLGFPDIKEFVVKDPFRFIRLDEALSNSPFKKLSFAIRIKAHKDSIS